MKTKRRGEEEEEGTEGGSAGKTRHEQCPCCASLLFTVAKSSPAGVARHVQITYVCVSVTIDACTHDTSKGGRERETG